MQLDSQAAVWRQTRKSLIPATVMGTVLEFYDALIYAQAAALVFGVLFFPEFSATAGVLLGFATFGAGYLARPLGALIFGHIGDKYGRKISLVATLLLMGVSTTLIGLLPTYVMVGAVAPLLLVVLRLFQGLGSGAEYAGATVMVAESAPAQRRGFFAALPASGIYFGSGLAAGVGALVATLPQDQLLAWGWRIPFLVSIALVSIGLYVRLRVLESPVFTEMEQRQVKESVPAIAAFREAWRRMGLAFLVFAPLLFAVYLPFTFVLTYLGNRGISSTTTLIGVLLGCGVAVITGPLSGFVSDKVGRRPVNLAVLAFTAVLAFPFFMLLNTERAVLIWIAMALMVGASVFTLTGVQAAFLTEIFDPEYRYTTFALSREFGAMLLSAPAPTIAVLLATWSGGEPWLIAAVIVVLCLIGCLAVVALPETRAVDMSVREDRRADEPSEQRTRLPQPDQES